MKGLVLFAAILSVAQTAAGQETTSPTSSAPTAARTCGSFLAMQFDVFDFDSYERYFTNSSTMTLAQAGVYTGVSGIKEYVMFASDVSPYISSRVGVEGPQVTIGGFDTSSGDCLFNSYVRAIFNLSPYGSSASIEYTAYVKIYYNPAANKISKLNVYYSTGFLDAFFTSIDTTLTRELVCSTMSGCSATWAGNGYTSAGECLADLATLPLASGTGTVHADGLDRSCRYLHTVFAATNPNHCNHVSFGPLADPEGHLKCQASAGVMPLSLYTTEEMAAFNVWVNGTGMDPDLGFMILNTAAPTSAPTAALTGAPTSAAAGRSVWGRFSVVALAGVLAAAVSAM